MAGKGKTLGDAQVGKGRPPRKSRWPKGKSGNPNGRAPRSLNDAERIEREFRRKVWVTEFGEKVGKTNFAIIHSQLLAQESAGSRRAGRLRDLYEAFARAHEGMGTVTLRFLNANPPENHSKCDVRPRPSFDGPLESSS